MSSLRKLAEISWRVFERIVIVFVIATPVSAGLYFYDRHSEDSSSSVRTETPLSPDLQQKFIEEINACLAEGSIKDTQLSLVSVFGAMFVKAEYNVTGSELAGSGSAHFDIGSDGSVRNHYISIEESLVKEDCNSFGEYMDYEEED